MELQAYIQYAGNINEQRMLSVFNCRKLLLAALWKSEEFA